MTSSISQVGSSGSQPFHCLCNQVGLYVILSVCEQDYCKSNRLISLKLGVMIGPTNRSNFSLCNQVGLYVILSVCEEDYCKSNRSISLKLGVMIGPTNRSNFTLVYAIRLVCTSFCLSVCL